jgi:sirohydrochlorin cobaltochelatase
MNEVTEALRLWLDSGGNEIGEIHIRSLAAGWELRHRSDAACAELTNYSGAEAARELAHYTSAGEFRPLKTAPNLRRGWRLTVSDLNELRRALDYFYPAMLGIWVSHNRGSLAAVPLRTTLARQTGMYRVTQKLSDEQAQDMIGGFCRSDVGCLKHILWPLSPDRPITSLPPEKFIPGGGPGEWPLLCQEACNLLVAQAREVVKRTEVPA